MWDGSLQQFNQSRDTKTAPLPMKMFTHIQAKKLNDSESLWYRIIKSSAIFNDDGAL